MLSDNFSPNTLRPIFSHSLSLKLETIKLDAFIQNYAAGQTLPGKVIQVLPEQKAVVELQGEKLLLQFPRPVISGQNIAVKIEQTHPNLVLKLTDFSSLNLSQKTVPGNIAKGAQPVNTQEFDKTSIQSRSLNENLGSSLKSGQAALEGKATGLLSKRDLIQLGLQVGHKEAAEVLRVVDRETLQVRFNGNEVTIKHAASQKLQAGDPVYIHAKSISPGKFVLAMAERSILSSTVGSPLELSVLKNYLPGRQPLIQVLADLKEVFLKGPLTQLEALNVNLGPLEQLQTNLQKIVSKGFKVPDATQLKEIVERSGFNYEAKVKDFVRDPGLSDKNALLEGDLKGQLMRFARQLEQLPGGAMENIAAEKFIAKLISQVNQAVNNIELQQLIHHFSKEEQHPLMLQLPENLLGEEDRLKIYILPDQREGADPGADFQDRVFNLVFLLNLSALGDLRIETKMLKDDISMHIIGSNSTAVQFIQGHVAELEDKFQEEGFSIKVTSSQQTEFSMEVPDSLGQLLVDTPLQIVDLKT